MIPLIVGLALVNIAAGLLLLAILPSFRRAVMRRAVTRPRRPRPGAIHVATLACLSERCPGPHRVIDFRA